MLVMVLQCVMQLSSNAINNRCLSAAQEVAKCTKGPHYSSLSALRRSKCDKVVLSGDTLSC